MAGQRADEFGLGDAGELRVGGVLGRNLLRCCGFQPLSEFAQVAGLVGNQLQAEGLASASTYAMPPQATSTVRVPYPSSSSGTSTA